MKVKVEVNNKKDKKREIKVIAKRKVKDKREISHCFQGALVTACRDDLIHLWNFRQKVRRAFFSVPRNVGVFSL